MTVLPYCLFTVIVVAVTCSGQINDDDDDDDDDVLQGMSYLESRGIVHRDLAARNVLGLFISSTSLSLTFRTWLLFVRRPAFFYRASAVAASPVLATIEMSVRPSVCPSVCLSVTR